MRVIWSDQAFLRLIEIRDFVARANPRAAEQLIHRIVERGDGLAKFPEMGRTVPELPGTGLREIIEGRYRIVYRVRAKVIQVITVFEGHRSFPSDDVED